MDRAELKAKAKQMINGNIGMLIVCLVIVEALTGACGAVPKVRWAAVLCITGPLTLGTAYIYLNLARGFKPDINILFSGFQRFVDALMLAVLTNLFTFLWGLLFVVPGIIKAISYSQAYYILAEHPEMSAKEALDESIAIMDGHKMDYFVLILSFIPWFLLCIITCSLAILYVVPYMQATFVNFYEEIKSPIVVNTNSNFTDTINDFYQG